MMILKIIQWLLGLAITFYLFKALLGKLRDGEGLRAALIAVVWLIITLLTSGLIKIN